LLALQAGVKIIMIKKITAPIKSIKILPSQTTPTTRSAPESNHTGFFHTKKPKHWTVVALTLIIVFIVVGASFISNKGRPVRTIGVERGILVSTISVTGNVVPAREVELCSQAPGIITAVHVKEGDIVRRGQTLATLDAREAHAVASKIKANLQVAEEELAQAQRLLEKIRKLYNAGGEPRQAVEDAESRQRTAENKVEAAREDQRIAHIGLANTRIQAPFAGLITIVTAQIGQWTLPGNRLLTLADHDKREIDAKVDAGDGGLVQVGQQANITSDAFPDQQWREKVLRLAPAIDKNEKSNEFSVRLSFGAFAPPLRLGQQVDVKIQLASKADAIKIPISTLMNRDGVTVIMVVRDGRVHFAPVRTGIEDMSNTEIVEGVQPGDRVILPEGKSFTEGEHVRIIDGGRP